MYDPNGNAVTKAFPGQALGMVVMVQNQGDPDNIFVTVVDNDTQQPIVRADGIKCSFYTSAAANQKVSFQIASAGSAGHLAMPNKIWNLTVSAGHGTLGTAV